MTDVKKSDDLEFEIELEEKKVSGGYTGHYKVTEKTGNTVSKQYSKFESTLGITNEEDWEAYILMSNMWKLPLSEEPFDIAVSTNKFGEETTTIIWNTFKTDNHDTAINNDTMGNSVDNDWNTMESLVVAAESISIDNGYQDVITTGAIVGNIENVDVESFVIESVGVDNNVDIENVEPIEQVVPALPASTESLKNVIADTAGFTCSLCGMSGIKDNFNLSRHIARMHRGTFKCSICNVEFNDRYSFNVHYKDCFYYCPIVGCTFKEKRQARLDGHLRNHSRM